MRTLEREVSLPSPAGLPATSSPTLVYRLLAVAASAALLGVRRRAILNGFLDTSGGECRPRDELFARFPDADRRRADPAFEHIDGVAEYRYWFVLDDGEPVACLDTSGLGWTVGGTQVDLMEQYDRAGRRVGAVLGRAFPDLAG